MKQYLISISLILGIGLLLASCRRTPGSMELNGDCDVKAITLDSIHKGTINETLRTITVGVAEDYDVTAMKVTDIQLSAGATADVQVGDVLNMSVARRIRVTNGDVLQDWTMSIQRRLALITGFTISGRYVGIIDQTHHTITVNVPASESLTSLTPTITLSPGATVDPASGRPMDFSSPVTYTVTNGSSQTQYVVTVVQMESPHVLFIGQAATMAELCEEERAACTWLLQNVDRSMYASFESIRDGSVDISECKVMWWHFHFDGGVDGKPQFENKAPEAIRSMAHLQNWFSNGGSFLLTRYATYLPGFLAINGVAATDRYPNNCWGGFEDNPETVSDPWFWSTESPTHPLYADLLKDANADRIYTCDAGYALTNSTAQWHIGSDWGGYPTLEDMQNQTGSVSLGHGGDGAVVAWEFPRSENNGGIICIGSGCYDWYSTSELYTGYWNNVPQMTLNAINYLLNE